MSIPLSGDPVALPSPSPADSALAPAGRPHLVVVTARAADAASPVQLVTRFWHPRDRAWREDSFESLEHAVRLFVDENGWQLLQQQALDAPHAHELIFQARRADFSRPSTEQILRDIGMSAERVADLLDPGADPGTDRSTDRTPES